MSIRSLVALLSAAGLSIAFGQEQARTGETIFRDMCASCHGDKGQGVADKYDDPLYGERSLASLSKYIDKNMPEDKADTLDADGSAKVAEYIYHAFYSAEARARNNPPRIDLTHLTNRQFQESVADLLGSFVEQPAAGERTGLHAEYFESNGMNKKSKLKKERDDAALEFDFGAGPPVEGCSAEQFSIAWQGSLIAEETGFYEFRLRTPNGARLYLNREFLNGDRNFRDDSDARRQPALIDEWVSSGDTVREATARAFLLGGRRYPIRLDYFKFKEKSASIKLEWKAPHAVWQVLRAPHISPARAAHVTVVSAPLPPDDSSIGYERGSAVSKTWHEATTKAAIEIANEVVDRMRALAKTRDNAPDLVDKLKAFGATLAERAFRRPLSAEEKTFFVDRHFDNDLPPDVSIKRSVLLIIKSPRFLYPEFGGKADDTTAATRLALSLWDSLPDAALQEAAQKGELHTPDQIRAQATRMMADPRAKAKLKEFFHEWLSFDEAAEINKDRKAWPEFDDALVADLRTSLDAFVDEVVWSEASDYRQLLLSDHILLNPRLAKFYGMPAPAEEKFEPVKFDPAQRAGVFTHPYLLAAFAHQKSTAPIKRGVFLTRNIMGRFLKPPPQAVAFEDEKFDPSLTMRQKVTELTRNSNCMGCHGTINPLGFSLENYDAVGRWRTTEQDKPIDPVADYTTVDGEVIKLKGARDLASHASGNRDAQRGFVRQMFQHAVKQPPAAYGPDTLARLHEGFTNSGFHIRSLLVEIAVTAAQFNLPPAEPATSTHPRRFFGD
ncbi:MAG TPA: DUF1592 domain-containing protein [Verrucomicrobiales bacterium]|nr:DUF1592 domain-containing protein [Verrucomicrobiales bacterium]